MGYAFVFNFILWLLVTVFSATAIAQEKESDTWTLLLTTPVSGTTVVFGKAIGLLRRMMWPTILIVAHFAIFALTGVISPGSFFIAIWVIVTFNTVWIATGIYLSLRIKTVIFAVILNLLLGIAVYGLTPALLWLGGSMSSSRTGDRMAEQIAWILPYNYFANECTGWIAPEATHTITLIVKSGFRENPSRRTSRDIRTPPPKRSTCS
jgi:ABC-type transport system involved in multi-copper enzyme maturation permease subunit